MSASAGPAEKRNVVAFAVECLRCGQPYVLAPSLGREIVDSECPRCGYVGWASSADLDEPTRRELREHPLDERRATVAA